MQNVAVPAESLDGKLTRDEIFVDLTARVARLTAAGRTPGLGTVLVGDDPGSHAYVRGKHSDCAKVGITSIRRDLPADVSQAELNATTGEEGNAGSHLRCSSHWAWAISPAWMW